MTLPQQPNFKNERMAFWQSLTSQVTSLSATKTAITSIVCNVSEEDTAPRQFVATAKSLISDASALVDSVGTLADVPAQASEALKACCRVFSKDTVHFVHAARGFTFDRSEENKSRFDSTSQKLDARLDTLLDTMMDMMLQYPEAGRAVPVPTGPAVPAVKSSVPTAAEALASAAVTAPDVAVAAAPVAAPVTVAPTPTRSPATLVLSPSAISSAGSDSRISMSSLPSSAAGSGTATPEARLSGSFSDYRTPSPSAVLSSSANLSSSSPDVSHGKRSRHRPAPPPPMHSMPSFAPTLPPEASASVAVSAASSGSGPPPLPSSPPPPIPKKPTAASLEMSPRRRPSEGVSPSPDISKRVDRSPESVRRNVAPDGQPDVMRRRPSESSSPPMSHKKVPIQPKGLEAPRTQEEGTKGRTPAPPTSPRTRPVYASQVEEAPKSPRFANLFSSLRSESSQFLGVEPKLHKCAAAGDVEGVKKILASAKRDISGKNAKGLTALQVALKNKFEVIALLLIGSGAELDCDNEDASPVLLAAMGEMYGAAELMLDRGVATSNRLVEIILHNGSSVAAKKLLENVLEKVDPLHKNRYKETYLHLAAVGNWEDIIGTLVAKGIDKNAVNQFGETCLHKAARVGNVEMVKRLVKLGVDESIVGDNGSALTVAHNNVKSLLSKMPDQAPSPPLTALPGGMAAVPGAQSVAMLTLNKSRGRALTSVVESMTDTKIEYWDEMQQLDEDVKRLAVHGSPTKAAAASKTVASVFEEYEGAMFELECGKKGVVKPPLVLATEIEPYRSKFYGKKSYNFFTRSWGKGDLAVLCVLAAPDAVKGTFSALLVSSAGEQPLDLNLRLDEGYLSKHMKKQLETSFTPGKKWIEIVDKTFAARLLELETVHSRNANCYRFAVVFGKADQKTEAEMFLNREGGPEFEQFLSLLAEKIELKGWSGYSGGLNQEDSVTCPYAYHTTWQGLEIILHVSTMMSPEQQRRLIGNDIGMIFFQPPEAEFRVAMRGNVNSVALVVAPHQDKYRVGGFRRGNIRHFDPPLPEEPIFTADTLRDFVFTKLVNGELQTHKSPPLSQLHARVFQRALADFVQSLSIQ